MSEIYTGTKEEIAKCGQIRMALKSTSPEAHYDSDDGHFRGLMLDAIPDKMKTPEEEEEAHFRRLMREQLPRLKKQ